MKLESPPPTFTEVARNLSSLSLPIAIGEIALSAASFVIPPRELPCRKIRNEYKTEYRAPNVLQPELDGMLPTIQSILDDAEISPTPLLDNSQLTRFISTMLQFSDRTPTVRPAMTTPYTDIAAIYDYTIETARENRPVTFAQQLDFALKQTDDIPTALWNLFLTSRQFARWRDSPSIIGLPEYTSEKKLDLMRSWYQSLGACKMPDKNGYQDVAGDAYYVWTHALARTIYDALPAEKSPLSEFYTAAFTRGSHVMSISRKLGAISAIGTLSDHVPAAKYGNAIGQLCADKVKSVNIAHSPEAGS
ncbi:MAG TPA: hypothetical protein VGO98_01520 [Candidatus Saccharimonadales bacterium]|jgi:hypothetical protein|nr:hypothetical protein [Candidatus Saccharimonadales bacterium]